MYIFITRMDKLTKVNNYMKTCSVMRVRSIECKGTQAFSLPARGLAHAVIVINLAS